MELIRNHMHMNKMIKEEKTDFYVSREIHINETNPAMNNIICHNEMVSTDNVSIRNSQVVVGGTINYQILYDTTDSGKVYGIEGEIPFEEGVKLPGLDEEAKANVRLEIADALVKKIDDRNYIYKVQITAYVTVERVEDLETVTSPGDMDGVMTQNGQVEGLSLVALTTETFRINDQVAVPSGKPEIGKIIWKDIRIENVATKLLDGKIHIGGELHVFIMYLTRDEGVPQQWVETTINFGGTVDMNEAAEDMVSYIDVDLHNVSVEEELDQDNEMRLLNIGAFLKLNIRIYEEQKMDILEDVYSPGRNLIPKYSDQTVERLLVKNTSRTKSSVKLTLDQNQGHILQVCNSNACVHINKIVVNDNGLKAVGKIKADVIYISSDDEHPICHAWKEIDFEHPIDAEGITDSDRYYINWRVEQVSANMLSTTDVEVKVVVVLETIVFGKEYRQILTDIVEEPLDIERMNEVPVLRGYIVKSGDTLWKLAKENYTTIDNIMKVNDLKSEQIKKGDRLLLLKSCQ